jgi:hypothetical protein
MDQVPAIRAESHRLSAFVPADISLEGALDAGVHLFPMPFAAAIR